MQYELKVKSLAYADLFPNGPVPVKILEYVKVRDTISVVLLVTGARGPYKRGEVLSVGLGDVIHRDQLYTSVNGHLLIRGETIHAHGL